MKRQPLILCIGAIDTSGGAGINQDIRIGTLHKCYVLTVITGITVQNEEGVSTIFPAADDVLSKQIKDVLQSFTPHAVKIGVVFTPEQIRMIAAALQPLSNIPVVWDPVLKPTIGKYFISPDNPEIFVPLLRTVHYLTPNTDELEMLSQKNISGIREVLFCATQLAQKFNLTICCTGGHISAKRIREALVSPDNFTLFSKMRRDWQYTHGTGCALAMALTCNLARGMIPQDAFRRASLWVNGYYNRINL